MEIADYITMNAPAFLFVLIRTGSILMTAPLFGAFMVPVQLKMGLSVLIALIITPLVQPVGMPSTLPALVVAAGGELFIGLTIGFAIRFVFTGIEFAGQIASFQMGIGMASAYDPINSAQITVIGRLLSILTLLVFLAVNGHLLIILALKKCFDAIPPYGLHLSGALAENFIAYSREIFVLAVKFSAPVVAALFFANAALGILARTVPQINMFVVGFSVTILLGFMVFAMSLPAFESASQGAFDSMWQEVSTLIGLMGHGG